MKKLLLVATFAVAGITGSVSATSTIEPIVCTINTTAQTLTDGSGSTTTVETEVTKKILCGVFYATCTAAYTCQDWTAEQWYHWGEQIQNNYCQL